jgi:hypothetical protein
MIGLVNRTEKPKAIPHRAVQPPQGLARVVRLRLGAHDAGSAFGLQVKDPSPLCLLCAISTNNNHQTNDYTNNKLLEHGLFVHVLHPLYWLYYFFDSN